MDYPHNPLIGMFPAVPQIVEFTLTPECNGFGYVPALLGDFYRDGCAYACSQGAAGCVGRVDYHLQNSHAAFFTAGPPVLTFDTENDFNVHLFSRLLWDPAADTDALWGEWAGARYGERGARSAGGAPLEHPHHHAGHLLREGAARAQPA